jgi:hypothetical protein
VKWLFLYRYIKVKTDKKTIYLRNVMWLILIFVPVTGAAILTEDCTDVAACGQLPWSEWTECSQSCGGGSQIRKREICGLPEWNEEEIEDRCRKPSRIQHRVCNAQCLNGGLFVDDICICKSGNDGVCCENGNYILSTLKKKIFFRISRPFSIKLNWYKFSWVRVTCYIYILKASTERLHPSLFEAATLASAHDTLSPFLLFFSMLFWAFLSFFYLQVSRIGLCYSHCCGLF